MPVRKAVLLARISANRGQCSTVSCTTAAAASTSPASTPSRRSSLAKVLSRAASNRREPANFNASLEVVAQREPLVQLAFRVQHVGQAGKPLLAVDHPQSIGQRRSVDFQCTKGDVPGWCRATPKQQTADGIPPDDAVEEPDDILPSPFEGPLEMRYPDPASPGEFDQVVEAECGRAWPGLQSAAHIPSRGPFILADGAGGCSRPATRVASRLVEAVQPATRYRKCPVGVAGMGGPCCR